MAASNRHGRAYLCRRCRDSGVSVIDRKGRMVAHILKHHIPLDKVPFSCSLCMFKAMEQKSLMAHVTKYVRHVRLAREIGVVDNSQYLTMSAQPAVVGEADMVMLGKEDSDHFFRRLTATEDQLDDGSDVMEDDLMGDRRATPMCADDRFKPATADSIPTGKLHCYSNIHRTNR